MTHRFGRESRLFKAQGSGLSMPRPAGSWPPQAPDLSKFSDKPKPPLGLKPGYCPPTHFWHEDLQTCVPYEHEVCEAPTYWSWQRWANCLYTAYPNNCVGSSSGIRYYGTPEAISAGGCVPSDCSSAFYGDGVWSWPALDCVPDTKPNPYKVGMGIRSSRRIPRRRRRKTKNRRRGRRR